MTPLNIFDDIFATLPEELFTTLHQAAGVRIERIVSQGQCSPPGFWYDQAEDEWVIVLEGSATIEFDGNEPVRLERGSYLNIPAHTTHRVQWTDSDRQTVWLAIHYNGRGSK
jgi:cupin 2 domain-containing protein